MFAEPHLESHLHKATGATTTREAGETATQEGERLHILVSLAFPPPLCQNKAAEVLFISSGL